MTGSERRTIEGGRRELPGSNGQQTVRAYQKMLCDDIMQTPDMQYLKALHVHMKCLKRTLKI